MNPDTNEPAGARPPVPGQMPDIAPPPPPPAPASSAPAPMTLPLPPTPAPAAQAAAPAGDGGDQAGLPAISAQVVDDGDVIEKDWVEKAKRIAAAYKADPYRQSEEMTIFKANYMKKRYGKDIKLK